MMFLSCSAIDASSLPSVDRAPRHVRLTMDGDGNNPSTRGARRRNVGKRERDRQRVMRATHRCRMSILEWMVPDRRESVILMNHEWDWAVCSRRIVCVEARKPSNDREREVAEATCRLRHGIGHGCFALLVSVARSHALDGPQRGGRRGDEDDVWK